MSDKLSDMYIVEALHEIRIIADRAAKNQKQIREYASGVSNIIPAFKTEAEQKKQVASLVQSTRDLVNRMLRLKRCIAFTNAMNTIEINGFTYSVTELIAIRQQGGRNLRAAADMINDTYDALDDSAGRAKFAELRSNSTDKDVSTVLYYDEAKRNSERDAWYQFTAKITGSLEVFNARTKLMDPDEFTVSPKEQITPSGAPLRV